MVASISPASVCLGLVCAVLLCAFCLFCLLCSYFFFFFFFSSRRRHTRSTRDWSSDVCSSDLSIAVSESEKTSIQHRLIIGEPEVSSTQLPFNLDGRIVGARLIGGRNIVRSEERRVGKEGRYRGAPKHEKEKKTR